MPEIKLNVSLAPNEMERVKALFEEYSKTMPEEEALHKCTENLSYVVRQVDDDFSYREAYGQ